MQSDDGMVEVRIGEQTFRGLWQAADGVMTVRVGSVAKSAKMTGMENYPETFARWLMVKIVSRA